MAIFGLKSFRDRIYISHFLTCENFLFLKEFNCFNIKNNIFA